MKKLLLVVLVLAFWIPASADVVIFKMTVREQGYDPGEPCPSVERLTETMWLVLEVDMEELALLGCGDSTFLWGPVLNEGYIFKTWRVGRTKLYDYIDVTDLRLLILAGHYYIESYDLVCFAYCKLSGKYGRNMIPRTMTGDLWTWDPYNAEGTIRARLAINLMKKADRQGWDAWEVILHLEDMQPNRAEQGNMCDPFWIP